MAESLFRDYCQSWNAFELPSEWVTRQERYLLLQLVDQQWEDHMRDMDYLRGNLSLHVFAQKDPLSEYKLRGFELFSAFLDKLDEDSASVCSYPSPSRAAQARTQRVAQPNHQRV